MRKLYVCFFLLFALNSVLLSQKVTIAGTSNFQTSNLYGPFNTDAGDNSNRHAYIYSASLFSAMPSGASITNVGFERGGTSTGVVSSGSSLKIYLANTSTTDFGTADMAWSTAIASATLVYNGDPSAIIGNGPGWKDFVLSTPFTYTGNNLAIYVEYVQTGLSTSINWVYNSATGQPAYSNNQTKYTNSTTLTPSATLTSEADEHPNLQVTFTTGGCTNPASPGEATSNASVVGVCPNAAVTLGLTNHSSSTGTLYKWQSSASQAGTYTDISAESTSPVFIANPSVTTWYRAVVKCGPSGTPQNSVPVQVAVNSLLAAGTYTINNLQPTGGTNFQSFSDAIERVNCGVTGHVIFEVSAGQTFTTTSEIVFQGSPAGTVTFRKFGVGSNPKIARSGTSAATDYVLKLSGADYVIFDGIDITQTGSSASDFVEYGIFIVNASATNGSQNNTFKNASISLGYATGTRGVFMDDIITPTATSGTNSFNKFLNMKIQNGLVGYYMTGASASFQDEGNQITTENGGVSQITQLGNGSVTGTIYGIYGTYQSNLLVSNTDIGTFAGGGTSSVYGSYFPTSASMSINYTNNHIHDLTGGGTVSGFFQGAGISLTAGSNHIHAIRSTTATSSAVRGMDIDGSAGFIANVFNNRVYDISSAGLTGTTVVGIELTAGSEFNVYNNMISDLRAPGSTTATGGVKGVGVVTTTAGSVVRLYYNTIYLSDAASAAAYTSAGIYNSSSTPTLDLRNNLVLNKTDVSAGTRAVAFWKGDPTINLHASTDNNLYYAGNPSAKNLIYYNGTTGIEQLSDYKLLAGMSPREENTRTENTALLPVIAGIIRMDPNTQSLAESGGQEISGYTTDFEGTLRGPYPLGGQSNGAGTNPDIGADEYDGRTSDILGPTINFTLLGNTSSTANRTIAVTITDPSGVRTGTDGPRLYYRKSGSTLFAFDESPTINGDTYTFTFNNASIGGVVSGDVIEYYIAAQDMNGYASTSPFGGAGANPPGTTAPSSTATYRILFSLNGVYTVGATGSQLNLTAIANMLNNGTAEVTGNTIFELQADYDGTSGETFPIQFNQFLTNNSNWTLTIRPAAGVTARITAGDPGSANPLINLNGIDRIIFDGRPGGAGTSNEWTLRNTRTSTTISGVFRLINDAANDTLRNLILEGQPTSTTQGLVIFNTSTGTTGNSFNGIINNIIRGRTDGTPTTMSIGIYASGTEAASNKNNTISGNHIVNSSSSGINISGAGNGANWLIDANHVYADLPSTTTQAGITITSDNVLNTTISNNYIGGSSPNATGTMTNTGNAAVNALNITGGRVSIINNTIANISSTNTGASVRTRGINFTSDLGNSLIQGNTIFNLSSAGGGTGYGGGSQPAVGIHYFPGDYQPITIRQNTIYNISIENTAALTSTSIAAGMTLTNMGGSVTENRIYNIRNRTTGTTSGQPPIAAGLYLRFLTGTAANNMIAIGVGENDDVQYSGILVAGGTIDNSATMNIYFNSVYVGGTSTGTNSSYAFIRGDNSTTTQLQTINLRNNILMNMRTGVTAGNFAIANQGTQAGTYWTSNYNVLYNLNAANTGFWNATPYDFTGWQVTSGGDANSVVQDVSFLNTSTGDLHLTGSSIGNKMLGGIPIAGVTVDFDLQPRNTIRPYMGADEGAIGLPVRLDYFKGARQGNVHVLNWQGYCTGDNNSFVVERSADGREFKAIGEVVASRAECGLMLGLTDRSPLPGINYYRLKIKDENSRISYSFVLAILNKETGFEIVSAFPTMTQNNLFVNVSSTHKVNLDMTIVDAQGRNIRKISRVVEPGTSLLPLDVNSLAAGSYILQCQTTEGYLKAIRFVKN